MGTATATDVNDNLQTAFTGLAGHTPDGAVEEFGPLTAASSGLPVAFFNRVLAFEPPTRETLADAVAWQADRELPFWVTFTDDILADVEALAADVGLTRTGKSDPGMVLPSLDHVPPNESPAVIEEVTTSEALDDFNTVAAAAFEMSLAVTEPVYRAALASDGMRLFVGRADDEPVACGLLVRTDDVAGVYTIGVVDEFRRQGIGEAMTWAVLRAGCERGCRVGALQSTDVAYPLYEKMGFETVVTYHHFEPAA